MTIQYHENIQGVLKTYGIEHEACRIDHFHAGQLLHEQYAPLTKLFLVVSGKAFIFKSSSNGLTSAMTYECSHGSIGVMEVFMPDKPFDCCTVALTDLTVITLPIKQVRQLIETNNDFVRQLAADLASQLHNTQQLLINTQTRSASERLALFLIQTSENDFYFDTIQRAATAIGITYRHAWRLFQTLLKENVLQKEKKGYRILDKESLARKMSVSD